MKQIERIEQMEACLNQATKAIDDLNEALSQYIDAVPAIDAIKEYYSSPLWKRDFRDDEKGKFPKSLQRGVLSEDAIYNMLEADDDLRSRLSTI